MLSRIAALAVVIPGLLAAQAIAESAIGSARAAVTTAPAREAAGKAIGAGLEKLGQVFQETVGVAPAQGKASPSNPPAKRTVSNVPAKRAGVRRQPAPLEPPAPKVTYEDPAGITEGMEYGEVVRRFGPPAMKFTSGPAEELLNYVTNDRSLDVQVRNGKVAAIR